MADYILLYGDLANFQPTFGLATVIVRPGSLQGTGRATLAGKKVCVAGDEKQVQVPGCVYVAGPFSVPGVGTLKIQSLAPNQKALKTRSAGQPVLLKGGIFVAAFEVQTPAQMPVVSTPDATPVYFGSGSFVTANAKFRGT